MQGNKPQYDVMIPVEFRTADKKMATKWNPVGGARMNEKGATSRSTSSPCRAYGSCLWRKRRGQNRSALS